MSNPVRLLLFLAILLISSRPFPAWNADSEAQTELKNSRPRHSEKTQRYEFQQVAMGVPIRLVLYASTQQSANQAAKAFWTRFQALNGIMTDYRTDSELMRMCLAAQPGQPQKVSPELAYVLSTAQALSERSGGAFDVTVGPVVKLWRRARRKKQLPDADRLAAALAATGYKHLHVKGRQVTLQRPGMRLDLGGIAKGYATDEGLKILRQHGIQSALIDAGGDIRVGAAPPGQPGWRIEIARLAPQADREPLRLRLANAAVATSGDAFQYIEIDGQRYSHIVDPQTGLGLTGRSSVTIVAPDGITADSLASTVAVLGPEKGLKLINQTPRTAAQIAWIEDGRLCETSTRTLDPLIISESSDSTPGR